jgi:NAD(P)-dependent dehydrogenase (short-subunit alcohol dehydrogenase family)
MSPDPHGKVALIVGGTSGIGLAAAKEFAAAGFTTIVAARSLERGLLAETELRCLDERATYHGCDVRDPSSVAMLVQFVIDRFGQLDCAANCAALDFVSHTTHEIPGGEAGDLIATDVLGVFHCMKYEIEAMLKSRGGTIVNVSSVSGLSGVPSASLYSAGRHAVIGLTRSAAREYVTKGIRINAVCPGPTDTPRRDRRNIHLSQDEILRNSAELAETIPIGRLARSEEIASAILWLSSPQSSYVVGHSLVIDGGLSA